MKLDMIPLSTRPLYRFYKEWLEAAEADNADDNDHEIFRNDIGLCGNLEIWLEDNYGEDHDTFKTACKRMRWQFEAAGLDHIYPFGDWEYNQGAWDASQHKDEKRLAWVRARIADVEEVL